MRSYGFSPRSRSGGLLFTIFNAEGTLRIRAFALSLPESVATIDRSSSRLGCLDLLSQPGSVAETEGAPPSGIGGGEPQCVLRYRTLPNAESARSPLIVALEKTEKLDEAL